MIHSFFFHPCYLSSLFPFIFGFISRCLTLHYLFSPFSILPLFHFVSDSDSFSSLSLVSLSFFFSIAVLAYFLFFSNLFLSPFLFLISFVLTSSFCALFFFISVSVCLKKKQIKISVLIFHDEIQSSFDLPSSVLRRLVFLVCSMFFSDFSRFLILCFFLIFFYQSSSRVEKKCRFVFGKFQEISLIQLLVFLCLVVNCSRTFLHAWSKKTLRFFLCCQHLFEKYLVSFVLIPLFLFNKKITFFS